MADLIGWGVKMKYMSRTIDGRTHRLLREITVAVVEELVYATPVLTGRARSSWRTGIGRQRVGVPFKPPAKPLSPAAGAQRSIEEAKEAVKQITVGGKTVYITSRLHYMGDLNDGTSKQQSAGFIQRAVMAGRNRIKEEMPNFWKADY